MPSPNELTGAPDVEQVGLVEMALVAGRGPIQKDHRALSRDLDPMQLDIAGRGPLEVLLRRVEAKDLLHGSWNAGGVCSEPRSLILVARKPVKRTADRAADVLETAYVQQERHARS